ncbi:MAG: retropepsin-like aspartic protease [Pseudomonadota bacterium]
MFHPCPTACGPRRPLPLARITRRPLLAAFATLGLAAGWPAQPARAAAAAVTLAGILGSKALLVIDGAAHAMGPGESLRGVRVVAVGREDATLEIEGRRLVLQLGGGPSLVGQASPSGTGRRIVMFGDSNGHFRPQGNINGQVVQFLVDTGATAVAIGQGEADRLGLPYRNGRPIMTSTANGAVRAWLFKLDSVRIGDVEVYGVDAVVLPQAMPYVLLGNSFLTQFQMTRTNDQMVLDKRF